jgi:hypothetical protein
MHPSLGGFPAALQYSDWFAEELSSAESESDYPKKAGKTHPGTRWK